jgi:hypothetical protein
MTRKAKVDLRFLKTQAPIRSRFAANENGTAILPVMMIGFVLAIFIVSCLLGIKSQIDEQAMNRTIDESEGLSSELQMLFLKPSVCQTNLNNKGFARTIAGVTSLSQMNAAGMNVYYPNGNLMLGAGSKYKNLFVKSVKFRSLNLVAPGNNSYRADLEVQVSPSEWTGRVHRIMMPFYLISTDGANITSCQATTYPDRARPTVTLEDAMCRQMRGNTGIVFRPDSRSCGPVPTPAPTPIGSP